MPDIRRARKEDCGIILRFIKDLAKFEHAPHEVKVTREQLEKDGFSEPRRFEALMAWEGHQAAGMALFYHRYSTWRGLTLYLEDLYVSEAFRKRGIATGLMKALAAEALERQCQRFEWQVLDWNVGAMDLYKSMGATLDSEWVNCKMFPQDIVKWLNSPS